MNAEVRLTLDLDHLNLQEALQEWAWLLGPKPYSVIAVSAFGDWFLEDENGPIHMVDVSAADFRLVADSMPAFERSLRTMEGRNEFLFAAFVEHMVIECKMLLGPGQCYSFKHPLYLGGDVDGDNVYVADFLICNKLNSTLWEQVKDVPDGAEVQIKIM